MPKYTELKPLPMGIKWKKQMIHFSEDEWNTVLRVANLLYYNDLSQTIKEALRLAKFHLESKIIRVDRVKEYMKVEGIEFKDLEEKHE